MRIRVWIRVMVRISAHGINVMVRDGVKGKFRVRP